MAASDEQKECGKPAPISRRLCASAASGRMESRIQDRAQLAIEGQKARQREVGQPDGSETGTSRLVR